MKYAIQHEIPGRIRFNLGGKIPEAHACSLEEIFLSRPGISRCVAYPKTGSLAVWYESTQEETLQDIRAEIMRYLESLTIQEVATYQTTDALALAPKPRHLFAQIAHMTFWRFARKLFLPPFLRSFLSFGRAFHFWKQGLQSLKKGRLDVPVLDAAAISMGFLQGQANTSSSTMYLLRVGEALEEYTEKQSKQGLIRSLLAIPDSARVIQGNLEEEKPIAQLTPDDHIVVRMGSEIPVDGEVIQGRALVNQASLTGESQPVSKTVDDMVYAGTVLEDGELIMRIKGKPEESKIRSIVSMVEQSEALKSSQQKHLEELADKLVPWNFLIAGIVGLVTRDITKVAAALMVDYSCALRLSGSIAVMAAQRESASRGFIVKGSKYFSRIAQADVIVFDKTGTLTEAAPQIARIVAYNGCSETEVLRLAACLEEHFPHPVARAVVEKALQEGLQHREQHAKVEYVVAHGIASSLDGKRVVIGSEHFVIEDEHVSISEEELTAIHRNSEGFSPLFLAVDGVLRGVLYAEDPVKEGIPEVLDNLRALGIKRTIMLTGDHEQAAKRIAEKVGIEEYYASQLPEDKYAMVQKLQDEGHNVIMVGDGVNDSPALAAASVSIAMGEGSAVAREAADIALVSSDMNALVDLRKLSTILEKRMTQGYYSTVAINSVLLALGISGVITPQVSSLLHNSSTVALSAVNSRAFLPAANPRAVLPSA